MGYFLPIVARGRSLVQVCVFVFGTNCAGKNVLGGRRKDQPFLDSTNQGSTNIYKRSENLAIVAIARNLQWSSQNSSWPSQLPNTRTFSLFIEYTYCVELYFQYSA